MRLRLLSIAFAAMLIAPACHKHPAEPSLAETLDWMDQTYNPHAGGPNLGRGHGRQDDYGHKDDGTEYLVMGTNETFTHDHCRFELRVEDDPTGAANKEMRSTTLYKFNLRDIDPKSIKVNSLDSHVGAWKCDDPEEVKSMGLNCDEAEVVFSTHNDAALVESDTDIIFPKLKGNDHELKQRTKDHEAYFVVDNVEYAGRFAKGFTTAVNLCGGKTSTF